MGKDRQNNNNNSNENGEVMLSFSLSVEDGWPPVGTEDIRYEKVGTDYRVLAPPLFLKGLSVDDVISVKLKNQSVASWTHLSRSGRTTIWLGRKKDHNVIQTTLAKLRELGCDTSEVPAIGCYAVDVPASLPISTVDSLLGVLDSGEVAVAFPSFRHSVLAPG